MQLICQVKETVAEDSGGDFDALLVEITPELAKKIQKLCKLCAKEDLSEARKSHSDVILFETAMLHDCEDVSPAEEDRLQQMQNKIEEQFEGGEGWFYLHGADQIQIPSERQVAVEDYIVELTAYDQEFFWTITERKHAGGWESSSISLHDFNRLVASLL